MRFSELYAQGEPIISLEFFPPKQESGLPQTLSLIRELSALKPHYLTVTYGAGGGTRSLTQEMVQFIHRELRFPVVSHLTCISHTRSEIESLLSSLAKEGISRVLALRGDAPKDKIKLEPLPDGFSNARDLVRFIREFERAQTPGIVFDVAVAGYPETHRDALSPEADLHYLKEKVDAGADLILTQLFFDVELYFRFRDRAQRIGIRVPIVPGVMPIGNVAQIKRFTTLCGATIPPTLASKLQSLEGDPEAVTAFGTEYAIAQCDALLAHGAPGIHLYTLNRTTQARPILIHLRG